MSTDSLEKFYKFGFKNCNNSSYYKESASDDLSDNAKFILEKRYYLNRYDSQINQIRKENKYFELCRRVSRLIASAESLYTDDINRIRLIENNIFNDMWEREFLFNSPALFNLGVDITTDKKISKLIYDEDYIQLNDYKLLLNSKSPFQMCFACFVLPVDDDLSSIFDSVKNAAIISMKGGGVGTNFGRTREKGALIRNGQGGVSSGPISWMKQWNTMATEVVQGGRRRAALMGMMDINHPDIEEFISCKDDDDVLSYFNISVAITDEFMDAVKNNTEFTLKSRIDSKYDKKVNARELWHKICEHAHKRGDPGIHFIDSSNQDSLLKKNKRWVIEATNPCGEMNLPFKVNNPDYKSYSYQNSGVEPIWYDSKSNTIDSENGNCCNLGSINLTKFIETHKDPSKNYFKFKEFIEQIHRSCYYLDLVIDASSYPLKGIEINTKDTRPIGLGFMGIHDVGIMLNMPFKTINKESNFYKLCNKIGITMGIESLHASVDIVNIFGKEPFPENQCVKDLIKEFYDSTNCDILFENLQNNDLYRILLADNSRILPNSIKNTFLGEFKDNEFNSKSLYIFKNLYKGNIRNSRRLSVAPTGCQSPDTLINTTKGLLRLDELIEIDPNNRWTDISIKIEQENKNAFSSKFFNNGFAKTKKIKLKSGLELECTHNHQYRILNKDNKYIWCRADELHTGDNIVYKLGSSINELFNTLKSEYAVLLELALMNPSKNNILSPSEIIISVPNSSVKYIIDEIIKPITSNYLITVSKNNNKFTDIIINDDYIINYFYDIKFLSILNNIKNKNNFIPKIIRRASNECLNFFINIFCNISKETDYYKDINKELLTIMRFIGMDGYIENGHIYTKESTPCKELELYGKLYLDEIVNIVDSENYTYDIEVLDNNTYIANSYVSHNTISLLCDVSSGVEPNFAYAWDRNVNISDGSGGTITETRKYIHKLVPEKYLNELNETGKISDPVFKTAMEIDPEEHLGIVSLFSKYIDCSISKTINLPNETTIEQVENIYNKAHELGIKGITIYRDGSRSSQPLNIKKKDDKDKIKVNIVDNISDELRRPLSGVGAFTQVKSPYGTLHVSAKFNENDEMREVFITLNKSGQELKAVTEGIARLTSIALQESADYKSTYKRIIKTLKGIAGFEIFVYDGIVSGKEYVVKSICDVLPYILPDLEYLHLINKYGNEKEALSRMIAKVDNFIPPSNDDNQNELNNYIERYNKNKKLVCPECGGTSFYKSDGCDRCLKCGYSKCSVG